MGNSACIGYGPKSYRKKAYRRDSGNTIRLSRGAEAAFELAFLVLLCGLQRAFSSLVSDNASLEDRQHFLRDIGHHGLRWFCGFLAMAGHHGSRNSTAWWLPVRAVASRARCSQLFHFFCDGSMGAQPGGVTEQELDSLARLAGVSSPTPDTADTRLSRSKGRGHETRQC